MRGTLSIPRPHGSAHADVIVLMDLAGSGWYGGAGFVYCHVNPSNSISMQPHVCLFKCLCLCKTLKSFSVQLLIVDIFSQHLLRVAVGWHSFHMPLCFDFPSTRQTSPRDPASACGCGLPRQRSVALCMYLSRT